MTKVELFESSPSVFIKLTFNSLYAAKKHLKESNAKLTRKAYYVTDIYGIRWTHRQYDGPLNTQYLLRHTENYR